MSGEAANPLPDEDVTAALRALDKHRLVLAIHDASFPGDPHADPGRGTPYSAASGRFLAFARRLGFDGVMLGPQGITARDNASPYDGTLFSRNVLNIDMTALAADPLWRDVVSRTDPGAACAGGGLDRARHAAAWDRCQHQLDALHAALLRARAGAQPGALPLDRALAAFRTQHRAWLDDDGLYFALSARHGHRHHRDWPVAADRALRAGDTAASPGLAAHRAQRLRELAGAIERHALGQFAVHAQHAAFHARMRRSGLRLYADLQVGLSPCDEWQHEHLFLDGYRLGAPPSRTNPEGQPWGYRVLDPDQYRAPGGERGAAMRFFERRLRKLLDETDGLRVDHPHGLVCPWVYRADDPDPHRAVRAGARLFSSPDLDGHPALRRHAIARPDQLAGEGGARHADDWVRSLDDAQVARYSIFFDLLAEVVADHGGERDDLVCEVLSTCPYPLARVMQRHGLGRFRVTQKADVHDDADVYRSENARAEDWIMVGNHDTPPMLALARRWTGSPQGRERAAYLAHRLHPYGGAERAAAELAADPRRLVEAQLADAFLSRAGHVLVFFPDLLGLDETYNRPGTVNAENWSLRVPPDYALRQRRGEAPDLRRVLGLALRARGGRDSHRDLIERLITADGPGS